MSVRNAAQGMAEAYPDIVDKKQSLTPLNMFNYYVRHKGQKPKLFFDQYDKGPGGHMKRSWGERRAIGVAARKYRNNDRMARLFYDKLFNHVVTQPSRAAKGLPERRDSLVLKAVALRQQQETNRHTRQARKAKASIYARNTWANTKLAANTSSQKAKRVAGNTWSKTKNTAKRLRKK
jgi:hypothetical protein